VADQFNGRIIPHHDQDVTHLTLISFVLPLSLRFLACSRSKSACSLKLGGILLASASNDSATKSSALMTR